MDGAGCGAKVQQELFSHRQAHPPVLPGRAGAELAGAVIRHSDLELHRR